MSLLRAKLQAKHRALLMAAGCTLAWSSAAWANTGLAQPAGTASVSVATPSAPAAEPTLIELCRAARRGDIDATYSLAWIYAYGKGTERNEGYASYLFFAASSAGHAGARRMLNNMTWPAAEVPRCLEEASEPPPAPEPVVATITVIAPPEIDKVVQRLAPRFQLDPKLVLAIIAVESNFNKFALSPKDAMGLMQLMPKTADRFKVDKPFDITDNIRGGMAYLRWLLAYFQGDLVLVAAAYNAGEGSVERYRGVPPFPETQEYVRKVLARVGAVQHPYDAKVVEPSPALKLMNKSARTP